MSAFTPEQTGYLSGFMEGLKQLQAAGLPFLGQNAAGQFTHDPSQAVPQAEETVYGTPIDELSKEERIKYEKNGLDCYGTIRHLARENKFVEGDDLFRFKYYGMFYVTPAQEAYMLRARVPGCQLKSYQFRGLAEIARDWGGGYCDITTRGNIQVRQLMPKDLPATLDKLVDLGLTSKGSGADNVRNVTASPTTGFDKDELIDVLPLARAMHHYILNNRDLYGLPRKFNISFDSGGAVSVCADTNDIAFYAVTLKEETDGLAPGVYFRMQLCGITGHKQFATDSGILLTAEETIPVAAAILRVFIENGDRTNRKKARLKYLVDQWGIPKLLEETSKKLTFPMRHLPLETCEVPRPKVKHGHLGAYRQKDGKNYLGIVIPVGRTPVDLVDKICDIADQYGSGDIRLTVWQNLIIPDIADEDLEAAKAAVVAAGCHYRSTSISGGLVACTGNTGCKYAAANTKGNAVELAQILESKVDLDQPINIHLTGCNHSCAQHYIGDIGMMGVKVKLPSGEKVEGYNIVLGGGVDDDQFVAREAFKAVPYAEIPALLENLLKTYLAHRVDRETFAQFTRRLEIEEIKALMEEGQSKLAA
ncbi:NirA family protein [Roseibacillus ishigakijimensis]|uniref:NirA family protein n=1 Tax=Roseibacillus ishigakijimensis TaxID=454146 RepID=A0A934RRR9_9BACT|nr:NirA family protein [Roseibacillus ishigakijimensis]MBK1833331.1 NirA family protein [Roseibacillus ishigakijimensis]